MLNYCNKRDAKNLLTIVLAETPDKYEKQKSVYFVNCKPAVLRRIFYWSI